MKRAQPQQYSPTLAEQPNITGCRIGYSTPVEQPVKPPVRSVPAQNVLDRKRWATRAELRLAIVVWIEKTYHRTRRQRRLGRLTPIEFETINQPALAA